MVRLRLVVVVFLIFVSNLLFAQQKVNLSFDFRLNDVTIVLKKKYGWMQDSIEFTTLKMYVSNIQLNDSTKKHKDIENYILLNVEDVATMQYTCESKNRFNQLNITFGIDSTLNSRAKFIDALDPLNNMYWTWQSGFINYKIEATVYKKNENLENIVLHLGGYVNPFKTYFTKKYAINNGKNNVQVSIELSKIVEFVLQNNVLKIMSPNVSAVDISKLLQHEIKISK